MVRNEARQFSFRLRGGKKEEVWGSGGIARPVRCLNCFVTRAATVHDNYWVNTDYVAPRLIILRNPEAVPIAATLERYTPPAPRRNPGESVGRK